MKTNLILLILFITNFSYSQIIESSYFSGLSSESQFESIHDYIKIDDGIIISGLQKFGSQYYTVIAKINLEGNIEWATTDSLSIESGSSDSYSRFKIDLYEDGFVYGYSGMSNTQGGVSIKLNPESGEVLWTNSYYQYISSTTIYDYDSESYFLRYTNAYTNSKHNAEISKITGDTLKVTTLGNYSISDLNVDSKGNVYIIQNTSENDELIKYNGKDFTQILWRKNYSIDNSEIEDFYNIYIDRYDQLFLLGKAENIKINPDNGEPIFSSESNSYNGRPKYIIEDTENIYVTYKHNYVGSVIAFFKTVKFDKTTGEVYWTSMEHPTPLNTSLPNNIEQSAVSMDIDCSGDIYLSGYYGSDNSEPAEWGIMKLNGNTGSKLYDLTITNDSTDFDTESSGKVVCAFGNTPLFLGHLETDTWEHTPMFVTIDPESGVLIQRKEINSESSEYPSATVNILSENNNLYALKQLSDKILAEKRTDIGDVIWEKEIEDSTLFARNISISGDNIYVIANNNSLEYATNVENNKISGYKLDALTGEIIDSFEISFGVDYIQPLEIESDTNAVFIFYQRNDSLSYYKWQSGDISEHHFLSICDYSDFMGNIDIIYNDEDVLLASAIDGIYEINKTTLNKTLVYSFVEEKQIYDLDIVSDTIYLCGKSNSNLKNIFAVDKLSMDLLWDKYYGEGCLYKMNSNDDMLFSIGDTGDSYQLYYQLKATGDTITTFTKSRNSINSIPLDIVINTFDYTIEVAGYSNIDNATYDGFFDIIDLDGNELYSKDIYSVSGKKSYSKTIALTADSCFLVGGAINEGWQNINHGFVIKNKYINLCQDVMDVSISSNNASDGICNGEITIDVSGGVPPFNYQWNNGENTNSIDNLCPNTYSVSVSDSYNCNIDTVFIDVYADTFIVFIDTITIVIDTCLFDPFLPVDSAGIYDFEILNADSAMTDWVFWQEGSTIYINITVPYTPGLNLVYLEIICLNNFQNIILNNTINTDNFYGIFDTNTIGIVDLEKINNVNIYPNPANNFLIIELDSTSESEVYILDLRGKIIARKTFAKSIQLNTKEFSSGPYVIQIVTDNEIITRKIIIE